MSNRIKVRNEVRVYELDGADVTRIPIGEPRPEVVVESHRTYRDQIIITVEGKAVTVVAGDLLAAIRNATNANG